MDWMNECNHFMIMVINIVYNLQKTDKYYISYKLGLSQVNIELLSYVPAKIDDRLAAVLLVISM
jgi:hypothetical protein